MADNEHVVIDVCEVFADGAGETHEGWVLTRCRALYALTRFAHCSCFSTLDGVELEDDDYVYTLEDIVALARNQADPRVPDVPTQEPTLLRLYALVLAHYQDIVTSSEFSLCVGHEQASIPGCHLGESLT